MDFSLYPVNGGFLEAHVCLFATLNSAIAGQQCLPVLEAEDNRLERR